VLGLGLGLGQDMINTKAPLCCQLGIFRGSPLNLMQPAASPVPAHLAPGRWSAHCPTPIAEQAVTQPRGCSGCSKQAIITPCSSAVDAARTCTVRPVCLPLGSQDFVPTPNPIPLYLTLGLTPTRASPVPQLLAVLRDGHRDVALQAFELTQALIEQHPAARSALLQADVVKVGGLSMNCR